MDAATYEIQAPFPSTVTLFYKAGQNGWGDGDTYKGYKLSKWYIGDANSDGDVNAADAQLMAHYIAGYDVESFSYGNADVDLDGAVTPRDSMLLARHLAGWSGYQTLPCSVIKLLTGTVIGEAIGWSGTAESGAAAAFDGRTDTFYDPTVASKDYTYCGLDLGSACVLTKIRILPREGQLGRYWGASIQGSNDMENWDTIFESDHAASSWTWQETNDVQCSASGYRYYRYWNGKAHGDVAEIELYGYVVQ